MEDELRAQGENYTDRDSTSGQDSQEYFWRLALVVGAFTFGHWL